MVAAHHQGWKALGSHFCLAGWTLLRKLICLSHQNQAPVAHPNSHSNQGVVLNWPASGIQWVFTSQRGPYMFHSLWEAFGHSPVDCEMHYWPVSELVGLHRSITWPAVICIMCGSRKYPNPPPTDGQWKFLGGGGVKRQKFPRGMGVGTWKISRRHKRRKSCYTNLR